MDSVIEILYDQMGEKVAVQLPYDEFQKLSALDQESALLRARVQTITELLQGRLNQAPALPPEPVKTVEPEPPEAAEELAPEPEPPAEPEPAPAPEPLREIPAVKPPAPGIVLSGTAPVESTAKEYAVPIPPMLLDFLTEQDPSQKAKRLIVACAQRLSALCGKRITLSLHKPYVCIWDFDEWRTFAFGEILQGHLYLSIESSLQPDADRSNIWVPPSGLYKKPLVRRRVDAITDELLEQLVTALNHHTPPPVAANQP